MLHENETQSIKRFVFRYQQLTFNYDFVMLARFKLAKRKQTKRKFLRNFTSIHEPNNELHRLLVISVTQKSKAFCGFN